MFEAIPVLGTVYCITEKSILEDPILENCDGYCDHTTKRIVISDMLTERENQLEDMEAYKKKVIRHELIHAFFFESGLGADSIGKDEELVDWIAMQFPKVNKVFEELGVM